MIVSPPAVRPRAQPWSEYVPSLDGFKEWWLDLVDPMRHQSPKSEGSKQPDEVQVAVFIAMPVRHGTLPKAGAEQVGDISIGISGKQWSYDDTFTDVLETRT